MVLHNPQHITDKEKLVCHLVVNNVFETHATSARAVFFFNIEFQRSKDVFIKLNLHICSVLNVFNDKMRVELYQSCL